MVVNWLEKTQRVYGEEDRGAVAEDHVAGADVARTSYRGDADRSDNPGALVMGEEDVEGKRWWFCRRSSMPFEEGGCEV